MPLRTGKELPVTPLGELLGFPASPRRSRYLVVVRTKASAHGLLVDRVSQVLTLSSEHLQPLPSTIAAPGPLPFSRVIVAREQFMLLVDPGKLLLPVAPRIDPPTRTAPAFPECSPPTRVPEQILLFRTQDFHPGDRPLSFAINLHRVREVVDVPDIIPVPLLPSCWVGLARWRERAVPVLDLAGWLGLPPAFFDRGTRLLIVQPHGGDVLALVIRTSVRMLRLPLAHRPCEQEVALDRSRIRGMVETTRETVVVPDLQQIAQA
jgi:chemotaxis signal transduction protein